MQKSTQKKKHKIILFFNWIFIFWEVGAFITWF